MTTETAIWVLERAAIMGLVALAIGVMIWVALHAMLIVHELGHTVAARLMGYPVRLVEVGTGRELLRLPVGLTLIRWRAVPSGGVTMLYRPFFLRRRTRILYVLGGCAANLVAIVALFVSMAGQPEKIRLYLLFLIVGQSFGVLQLFYVSRSRRTGLTPDGGALLAALRKSSRWDRPWVRRYLEEVREAYGGARPERATRLSAVALHALRVGGADRNAYEVSPREPGDYGESRRLRITLLSRPALTPAERAALLDSLITDAALAGEGPLAALDRWSSELVALLPDDPNAHASRGSALALMGRPEARKHLEMEPGDAETRFGAALRRAYLALALLNEGDVAGARAEIEAAKRAWAEIGTLHALPIIEAMEAKLSRAP